MRITPIETWTAHKIGQADQPIGRQDIEAYQRERLHVTLCHAWEKSRFYRQHLAAAPLGLNDLADIERLPFTTAEDIRSNPLQFLCVPQDHIQQVLTLDTSGTSGKPKHVYLTREDLELTIDFFQVGMATFTERGDRVLILLPSETPGSAGDLLAVALERMGVAAYMHGPVHDPAATMDLIRQERITIIVGMPTHVLALARQPRQAGVRIKSVLLVSDYGSDAIKCAAEMAWGCSVYTHYGMTEMGLAGGLECDAHRGYHFREADLFVEVIDPLTGCSLPDGETGEVVFTTLTREGMPLIRYRTGDVSRFIPGRCPCGTHLKSLERVTHRLDNQVFIENCRLTMAELDEALFSVEGVLDFSAILTREGGCDILQIGVDANGVSNARLSSALRRTLDRIPACQSARLRIRLVLQVSKQPILHATGKRIIVDQRPIPHR